MVKVEIPNETNTKFEIQKWLKKYSITFTPFQSKDDLLFIVSENKKNVIDIEKAANKAKKLIVQQQLEKELEEEKKKSSLTSSLSSSSSSSSSPYSSPFKTGRSLASPFKKITIKDGKVITATVSTDNQINQNNNNNQQDNNKKLNIIQKERKRVGLKDKVTTNNNTLHVFVSSTFRDMIGERDHLIKVVFPTINMRCKSKNLTVVPVDLRWGLTKEETTVKGQIELCLKQIDKCGVMISMVGSRFGWVPTEYKLASTDPDDPATRFLADLPLGQSITSIETRYGLSRSATKHSIAVFRDTNALLPSVPLTHVDTLVRAESTENESKLKELRQLIINDPTCPVLDGYPCSYGGVDKQQQPYVRNLDAFGQFVIDQMMQIIELEFPTPVQALDAQTAEELHHEALQRSKSQYYWGRESFQKKLVAHVHDNKATSLDKIAIVYGEPGAGKTSSLASLATLLESDKSCIVLSHFVGCSGDSTEVANILTRFSNKLVKLCKIKHEIPTNLEMLRIEFPKILEKAAKVVKHIILVIDDLDETSTQNQAHQMEWLPDSSDLPNNVIVFLSCDQNKTCWDHLHLRTQIPQTFYLTPLEMSERTLIASKTLERYGKRLESKLLDKLAAKTHAKHPLYIKLVCEELRVFGSFDKLAMFVQKLPDTIDQVIVSMLTRLEEDFGRDLIKKTLCFIALSRFGLSEQELLELLRDRTTKQPLSFVQWAPLLINIAPLLRGDHVSSSNSTNLIAFFHAQITKVIVGKYLLGEKAAIMVHTQLADYYTSVADPENARRWSGTVAKAFIELPYHLMRAKRFDTLAALFQDFQFVTTKFKLSLGRDLLENMLWAITETQSPTLSGERWTGLNFSSSNLVQDLYSFVQYQAHNIERFPGVAVQQAYNLPDDSAVRGVADRALYASKAPHFRWLNKPQISDFVTASLAGHEDFVRCALYREDGTMIASCSDDRTVRIWSGETGALTRIFPKIHTDKVTNLQWRGNNSLVTVSRDKRVVLWDEFGKVLHEFNGHTQPVWGVAVSGDGKRIASASWDTTCIVWDVPSKQRAFTLTGHTNKLSAVAYSRDSSLIATGCWSGIVIIWDAKTGKQITSTKVTDTTILYLSFAPNDSLLAVACVDSFTHILSRANSWSKPIARLEGHKEAVISARFASDGKYIVSCSDDKTVRVFDAADWTQVSVMTGHSGRIISAAFHPSSSKRQIITSATDKFIKIWDPKLGYAVAATHQGHRKSVTHLQYDEERDILYSASDDRSVREWTDFQRNDTLVMGKTLDGLSSNVKKFRVLSADPTNTSSPRTMLAQIQASNAVVLYNYDTQATLVTLATSVSASAFSNHAAPSSQLIAYSNAEGVVSIIHVESRKELYNHRHGFVVNELSFSPSNEYLAASDGKGTLTILKLNSSSNTYSQSAYLTLEPMSAITSLSWASNGGFLAAGATDGSVHLFDVKRSFHLVRVLRGHVFAIRGLSFSPLNRYLFTASLDKQSILWDVETGEMKTVFPLFSISTSNILFFRDNQNILTTILSDYTGKIHHCKLLNCDE